MFSSQEDPNRPVPKEVHSWRIYMITFFACLGQAMVGYDLAYIGGSIALPSFQAAFGIDNHNRIRLSSYIVSTLIAGSFLGAICAYFVAERLGRRAALLMSSVFACIGGGTQLFPGKIGLLYAGRAISGIGIGGVVGIIPVYLSELAPSNIRGRLVGFKDVVGMVAQLTGYWINYTAMTYLPPTNVQWRLPVGLQLVAPGLVILTMPWMVESPRWLAKKGLQEQALKTLAWARNLPQDHEYVQWEFNEICTQISANEGKVGSGWRADVAVLKMLWARAMRRRMILSTGAKVMHCLTGNVALALYSPLIFASLGFDHQSLLLTGIYGAVKVVTLSAVLMFSIDRWGRKPTVLIGSTLLVLCKVYLGTYTKISGSFTSQAPKDAGAYLALVTLYLFTSSWAASWSFFPCVFASEVFPTHLRALAMTLMNLAGIVLNFAVAYSVPHMLEKLQWATFYFFGACTAISTVLVWLFYPETKGFPLEDMHLIFDGPIRAYIARRHGERLLEEERAIRSGSEGSVENVGVGRCEKV